jgi:hypothetical protein
LRERRKAPLCLFQYVIGCLSWLVISKFQGVWFFVQDPFVPLNRFV